MKSKVQILLQELQDNSSLRELRGIEHMGKFINFQNQKLLNFASNDYLGIAQNTEFQQDFLNQCNLNKTPFSTSSSRILSGNFEIFEKLEALLSQLFSPKDALLFNSGYHANLGVINALSQIDGVLFLADSFVHASIFDGLKLSKAKFMRFAHNDMQELESLIQKYTHQYQHIIILTEGIYSMDGDTCDIQTLVQIKKQYQNVLIYIDEAHSIGVCGENMLGITHAHNLIKEVDFIILAFGKAIGSMGGCVLCDNIFKQYFINKARTLIFSTAIAPINIAFTYFVFQNLLNFKTQQNHLNHLGLYLKTKLMEQNIDFIGDTQILSLMTYSNEASLALMQKLFNLGFYAPSIRYPSVPKNHSRIRISLNANLKTSDIDSLIEALCK